MSHSQIHKIHTTSLQVQFDGIEEGLGLQDRLALVFHEKIKPALEKEFDQLADPKTTLVIDSLVLDCGYLPDENWEETLHQQILEQVRKEIAAKPSNQRMQISKEIKANEVFFFFMAKGHFPWNSPFASTREVEKAISTDTEFMGSLMKAMQKSSLVTDRLFHSFSTKFISGIYGSLGKTVNPKIPVVYSFLQKQGWENVQKELLGKLILHANKKQDLTHLEFLRLLVYLIPIEKISDLAGFVGSELIQDKNFREAFSTVKATANTSESSRKIDMLLQALGENYPASLKKIDYSKINQKILKELKESTLRNQTTENLLNERIAGASENILHVSEDIFIENAGLVILHPFISGLFGHLQLLTDGKFEKRANQHLGAKILQFLVYGENDLTENSFVLNKILCGMDVFDVLELSQEIEAASKEECEKLLQDVIGHWAILKNTSVDGLRETFLQRNGKISRTENGWKLKVERKTVDILMNKLPWGIGMIKLPWMNEMMYVDWD